MSKLDHQVNGGYYLLIFTALILLFINDHFLKWQFHNCLTGKLSDFLGLFLLPLLLYLIGLKKPLSCVLISGVFFVFWKSTWSTSWIDYYNQVAWIPITRVVDMTDLLALSILPLSYCMIKKDPFLRRSNNLLTKLMKSGFILLCSIVFMATSPPIRYYYKSHSGDLDLFFERKTNQPKANILERMARLGLIAQPDTSVAFYTGPVVGDGQVYYIIPEILIEEDTIRNLQFAIREGEDQSWLYINGMQLEKDLSDDKVEKKLRKYYRKLLDRYLVDSIIKD